MKILRLGILGTGIATRDLYWPQLKKLKAKIAVTAVANRTRAKAERFARFAKVPHVCEDARELFKRPDVDAVVISLPIEQQPRFVLQALQAGKHVLSEKPVAPDLASGRRFVPKALALAKRRKRVWLVGENYFFAPHIVQALRWLTEGALGDLRLVEASQLTLTLPDNPYFQTKWRQKPKFEGGFVVDAGVHLADVVRRAFGMPVEVGALTTQYNPALKPIDTAVAVLRFRSGVLGLWKSCFSSPSEAPMLRVLGSRADLEVHRDEAVLKAHTGASRRYRAPHDSFYGQFEHFHAACTKGAKLAFTPGDALADLEFMDRIVRGGK